MVTLGRAQALDTRLVGIRSLMTETPGTSPHCYRGRSHTLQPSPSRFADKNSSEFGLFWAIAAYFPCSALVINFFSAPNPLSLVCLGLLCAPGTQTWVWQQELVRNVNFQGPPHFANWCQAIQACYLSGCFGCRLIHESYKYLPYTY